MPPARWYLEFMERYESRYPDWDFAEGPRDEEHQRLLFEARPSCYSNTPNEPVKQPNHFSITLDDTFITTLEAILQIIPVDRIIRSKACWEVDAYGEKIRQAQTLRIDGITADEFLSRVAQVHSTVTPGNTLGWAPARVQLGRYYCGAVGTLMMSEYAPVYARK